MNLTVRLVCTAIGVAAFHGVLYALHLITLFYPSNTLLRVPSIRDPIGSLLDSARYTMTHTDTRGMKIWINLFLAMNDLAICALVYCLSVKKPARWSIWRFLCLTGVYLVIAAVYSIPLPWSYIPLANWCVYPSPSSIWYMYPPNIIDLPFLLQLLVALSLAEYVCGWTLVHHMYLAYLAIIGYLVWCIIVVGIQYSGFSWVWFATALLATSMTS